MGSAFLLPLIGEAATRKLVLMSEFVPAAEALAMKLVHEVVAEDAIDARILEIAARLRSHPPSGIALTKEWWRVMGDAAFHAAMDHARQAHAKNFAAGGLSAGASRFVSGARA
jgi:enoyl-CoA hydratase/carnithine racemase